MGRTHEEGVTAPDTRAEAGDPSLAHLLGRLGVVEQRVRDEVARRRAARGGDAADPYRGLYVSDERVDEVLAGVLAPPLPKLTHDRAATLAIEAAADDAERAGAVIRLRRLARTFDLSLLDVELLLIAAAPALDAGFETLYGYCNDDVSLRHATVGLALRLCGLEPASAVGRARFAPGAPLVDGGLVAVDELERPQLTRAVRVPDRVVAHLLGDDTPAPEIAPLLADAWAVEGPTAEALARALTNGATLAYLRERPGADGVAVASAALAAVGADSLTLDLARLPAPGDLATLATAAAREAGLRGAGLVAGPVDVLVERGADAVRAFTEASGTVVLVGRAPWDPSWSRRVPLSLDAHRITDIDHRRLWEQILGRDVAATLGEALATAPFRLTPRQIARAAAAARQQAAAEGRELTAADLQHGIRAQNAVGLERLARRIEPRVGWDDLVVPSVVGAQLRELSMRWRHRDLILEEWGMGRGVGRGRGVSALFAGASGTGKTLAAEVIAAELGLDLYLVDLSTVVDKYIGETSKNLERIFDEADRVNGVLLFDEADALFGKRSAVSDAKDRHANVEVAYLLQRMETFDGVAILTTNLAANLDDAFLRRLDAIVDFPSPDAPLRRLLWAAQLGPGVPQSEDIDLDDLATRFELSGSEIRNVVVSAAYHGADRGSEVTMRDLVEATVREHRKIGRRLTASDLGDHAHLLDLPR